MMRSLKNSAHSLYKRLFKDRTEAAIFFTAFLVEIAFGLYLVQRWGFTFSFADSVSHLYIPSTIVNNGSQNNIANLGTIWLPMFHILVMPLILINPLLRTGFAATIVNGLATGGICVILYRLVGDRRIGILSVVLFMSNAYTLIFGASPMMEQTGIFFILLAAYYFKRYWENDDLIEFMKCSLVLLFGCLTRYELWAVALLVALFFTVKEVRARQFHRLAYLHFPFWGVFAWLFWNLAIFRDPLMFINHPAWLNWPETQYRMYNPLLTTSVIFESLYPICGLLYLISLSYLVMILVKRRWNLVLPSVLLLAPLAFQWISMFFGRSGGWLRYFYLALPGLIMLSSLLIKDIGRLKLSKTKTKTFIAFTILVIITLTGLSIPEQTKILAFSFPSIISSVDVLKEIKISDYKSILSCGCPHQGAFILGILPKQIIDEYDGELFIRAMKEPWKYAQLVLIPNESPAFTKVANEQYDGNYIPYIYYNDDAWKSEFLKHYELIFQIGGLLVFNLTQTEALT